MSIIKKKYVYIQKGVTDIWNKFIIGNIYEIENNTKTCGFYPYYSYYIPKHNLYIDNSDLWFKFIPLEEWREQRINKILEND